MNHNSFPIVEAKVLSYYDSPNELNKEITSLLKDGWEISGSISVIEFSSAARPTTLVYTQTMVKRNYGQFAPEVIKG